MMVEQQVEATKFLNWEAISNGFTIDLDKNKSEEKRLKYYNFYYSPYTFVTIYMNISRYKIDKK